MGFDPTVSAGERPQTYDLDRRPKHVETAINIFKKIASSWFYLQYYLKVLGLILGLDTELFHALLLNHLKTKRICFI
jgi:hypothetical protein